MSKLDRRAFLASAGALGLAGCENSRGIDVLLFNVQAEVRFVVRRLTEFYDRKRIAAELHPTDYEHIRDLILKTPEKFDVMYVDDVWMAEFAHPDSRRMAPLTRYIARKMPEFRYDFSPAILDDMARMPGPDGKPVYWMVPQRADVQVLYYNREIFDDPDIRAAFRVRSSGRELSVPQTWEDYAFTAKHLSKLPFRDSVVTSTVETLGKAHYAFEFFACRYWAQARTDLFDSDRDPKKAQFAVPGVAALQLIHDVMPYAAPESIDAGHTKRDIPGVAEPALGAIDIFTRGYTAMMPQWYSFYSSLSNQQVLGSKLGVALLPGVRYGDEVVRTPCLGGGSLAIRAGTDRMPMAWEFIRFFTGIDMAEQAADLGLTAPRFSAYENLRGGNNEQAVSIYRQSLELARPRPRHHHYARLEGYIGDAVNQALRVPQDTAKILQDAQNDCDEHFTADASRVRQARRTSADAAPAAG